MFIISQLRRFLYECIDVVQGESKRHERCLSKSKWKMGQGDDIMMARVLAQRRSTAHEPDASLHEDDRPLCERPKKQTAKLRQSKRVLATCCLFPAAK